jgi:hypothetical protein
MIKLDGDMFVLVMTVSIGDRTKLIVILNVTYFIRRLLERYKKYSLW